MEDPKEESRTSELSGDYWKSTLVEELSDHVFTEPTTRLGVVTRGLVALSISLGMAVGLMYWRHPELFSNAYYHENPVEVQLDKIPTHQRELLESYTKHLHESSRAAWTAVYDWRTLKDVKLIKSYGTVPERFTGWHSLPQEFSLAISQLVYERCFSGDLGELGGQGETIVCPILGNEDVWGYIVIHSPTKTTPEEIKNRLRVLASRWSDYLY